MKMGSRSGVILACLLLAGCATDRATPKSAEKTGPQTQNVSASNDASATSSQAAPKVVAANAAYTSMIGSKREELIKKLGHPNMTMDVTLAGRPPSEGYLYYPKDGQGCVHTFVLVETTEEIIDYFCR